MSEAVTVPAILSVRPEHKVVSKQALTYPLIRIECSCGYWQQKTHMNYFESVWLKDEIHMLWASQNPNGAVR